MQQRRWVSYIYRYREQKRCEIAGFVKVQRITGKEMDVARIRMGLKMYKDYPCCATAYLLLHGQARKFTTIDFAAGERDTLLKSVELPWKRPLEELASFPEYEGLYFLCDDGEELAGIWTAEEFHIEQVQPDIPTINYEQNKEEQIEEENQEDDWFAAQAQVACSCQEMISQYPKLPVFAGSQILDGVKIGPQDIGRLDMAYWKLSMNSFVSHGYYKYQYLMLGRVKMNKQECYVLGVPGIFTNKERYLANLFGFHVFLPVKRTRVLTGNFGYWVSQIIDM
ncbi:MAG: DUF6128 domain-containing protein [Wujia sp.]